ncbi:mannose/glucose-specific lectin-like [Chenopodium quinoa]|uniref:mannose/glucose-specific lectin-like n=1 Tax=Chenopodium quinoa TaxID=63459 RepID=UPI000B778231|nr:mannose/glucose-specific lectin-like [Chenopodium quinoa]
MAQIQKYGPYGDKEAVQNFSLMLQGSDRITEIKLQIGEYITGISGFAKDSFISQMKIHTTLHPRGHGPYGTDQLKGGYEFKSPMPVPQNDRIVGFFGTAHDNLVSVGVYAEKQSQTVEKLGPFGYQTGHQWSILLEPSENLREIIIKTGAIVDSFTFVTTKTRQKFGGDGGNAEHKITLQSGEFITNVSGWIGEWQGNRCLTKLKLHTNLRVDGYGPFGGGPYTNYLSEFRSQVPSGGRVVGFFGTIHNNYVESIGLYVKQ